MNLSRFDPFTLRIFLSSAQHLSFTKAANECCITLSAVSKRISELEKELQCTLFIRLARGLELTAGGYALVEHAQQVIASIQRLSHDLQAYSLGLKGQVRIWANTSSVIQFLPQDLTIFCRQHPDIRLSLEERVSHEIISALTQGQIDMGIFADNIPSGQLEKYLYRHDELVLLVPLNHPFASYDSIAFADTLDHDFVGLSDGASLLVRMQDAAMRLDKPLRLRVQVNSFDAICHMIEAGLGIGVLPRQAVRPEIIGKKLMLVSLEDAWSKRTLWLGTKMRQALTPQAETLFDFLLKTHSSML